MYWTTEFRTVASMTTESARALLRRLGQFALVVFIGVNVAYLVTHATPIDPVEQSIAAATAFGCSRGSMSVSAMSGLARW